MTWERDESVDEGDRVDTDDVHQVPVLLSPDVIVLPRLQVSLTVSGRRGLSVISLAQREHSLVALVPPGAHPKGVIATLCQIMSSEPNSDGLRVNLRGLWRIRVSHIPKRDWELKARFEHVEEQGGDAPAGVTVMKSVFSQIDEFTRLIPDMPEEVVTALKEAKTPGELADLCGITPTLTREERIDLLKTLDSFERLKKVNKHFKRQLSELRKIVDVKPIPECEACTDLADRAFDSDSTVRGEVILEFLNHVISVHTGELLNLLAEKYGPTFLGKRALR